jgi:hypothetical protein
MQNDLETMFRRWAELEPDRCEFNPAARKQDKREVWQYVIDAFGVTHWIFPGDFDEDFDEFPEIPSVLEYATREAIEARGWSWIIESSTSAPKYGAALDEMGNASLEWKNADTSAEALLSAYLSALESQNAKQYHPGVDWSKVPERVAPDELRIFNSNFDD